jgi:hypothetical protein
MIAELEVVVLTRDLTDYGLEAGDVGTVVMVHEEGAGYDVEFVTFAGETVAVVTLCATDVRPIRKREIAHARVVV